MPVGATIMLEARAFDGEVESTDPVTVGPAVVLSNTVRWVQHWPDRSNIQIVTYDPQHDRVLIGTSARDTTDAQLWEHVLSTDTFVRLRPTGTAPTIDYLDDGIYDPVGHRFLFFPRISTGNLAVVELQHRSAWPGSMAGRLVSG